jgi:DNA-binding SARP family transcriptional activator
MWTRVRCTTEQPVSTGEQQGGTGNVAVEVGVLGPVAAWGEDRTPIPLKGPRHRAVLALLVVARGRVVPTATLIDDLWSSPPDQAPGVIQTFVSALRRALEPERAPRAPARLLVTEAGGYALRMPPEAVDAWRFESAVDSARTLPPSLALPLLEETAAWWRGPAYADFPDAVWAHAERSRLREVQLSAVELRARVTLDLGRADAAVPDLDAHVAEHPWREEGWRLLALALYRTGRQKDALDVVRRGRARLDTRLGLEPGPDLARLENDILNHAGHLHLDGTPSGHVWSETVATYSRTVAADARARLRSTVELLRSLAVTGGTGLVAARKQRLASILAAEELGDVQLTARVLGGYDVPAIWARSDDPVQAAAVVAAAERTLAALPADVRPPLRARLLTTIAIESRGTTGPRGLLAAREAEAIARGADDPPLLAFALNGLFMQTFASAGLCEQRDTIGAELLDISTRHGLETYEVLARLIRMQARAGLGDFAAADEHAIAVDDLAERYGSPLAMVFTTWYRALRIAAIERGPSSAAYRIAAVATDGAGMPGLHQGLLPLVTLADAVRHHRPAPADDGIDWGPYTRWARPLVLIARGEHAQASTELDTIPDSPPDHLLEALWCLVARAATTVGHRDAMERALTALTPAATELAGAGSGVVTLGPVDRYLAELTEALAK